MYNKEGLTGADIIKWIQDNKAENKILYFQSQSGYAYKECKEINFEEIGWFNQIIAIKG